MVGGGDTDWNWALVWSNMLCSVQLNEHNQCSVRVVEGRR